MRVISYLESSFWTMRAAEFGTMMRVAYAHAEKLDAIAAQPEPKPQSMAARPGVRMEGTRYVELRDGVAVIDVNGIIAKRMSMFEEMCYGGTSTEKLLKDFTAALESPAVDSIVLNIDSPGGEAFGINELANAIYAGRAKKPVHAYVSGLGCSGAYWIASAAEEVVTDKSAFLGSIGVVTAWMDDKEFYKGLGIRREVVTSSNAPLKRLDFDNDEHRAELQKELDSLEKVFHKAVARNRKVTVDQVISDFNRGGVLAGADAVKAGMADRVGSLEEVIKGLQTKKKREKMAVSAEGDDMGFKDFFGEFAAKHGFTLQEEEKPADETVEEPKKTEETTDAAAAESTDEAEETTVLVKVDVDTTEAQAKVEALQTQLAQTQAAAFVEAEVKAGRMYPSEKEKAQSLFVQAAKDDMASPLAEGSRVGSLQATYAARKPHGFTQEKVSADDNSIFILGLGGSEKTEMQKAAEAQADAYVATVTPKANLKAVN